MMLISSEKNQIMKRENWKTKEPTCQVKKSSHVYENEIFKSFQMPKFVPNSFGDRFIPRRYSMEPKLMTSSLNLTEPDFVNVDILKMKKVNGYWRLHNLRGNIDTVFNLMDSTALLKFHESITREICRRTLNNHPQILKTDLRYKNVEGLDWECKPRPMPLATNDSTHDLPGFDDFDIDSNIIDWSKSGLIAAAFKMELVLWTPPAAYYKLRRKITEIFELGKIQSLAFDSTGERLALSIDDINACELQILHIGERTVRWGRVLFQKPQMFDQIRSIAWDPSGENIVCGFKSGLLKFLSMPKLDVLKTFKGHTESISNIKYSSNRTFIGIVDVGGKLSILRSDTYELYMQKENIHFFVWHPWHDTDLFVGCANPAEIMLLDLLRKAFRAYYKRNDYKYWLHAIAINPLSAELVASFSHEDGEGSHILVLSAMNRIVDSLAAHKRAVNFILWNPTGTHVGTAGSDESLNIWNFFGMSQKKAKELQKLNEKSNKMQKPENSFDLHNVFSKSR